MSPSCLGNVKDAPTNSRMLACVLELLCSIMDCASCLTCDGYIYNLLYETHIIVYFAQNAVYIYSHSPENAILQDLRV